jgi:GNAT superfamily N-acetyltransferase
VFVRLAIEADFDDIVRMGRLNVELTQPDHLPSFNESILRETLQNYLEEACPTVWVVESKGKLIGFMFAGMCAYDYRAGLFTTQKVLFVSPENRGSRAATLLVKELIRWSKSIGAVEIKGGNDNGFNSDRTAEFLEHFGFERVGHALTLRLSGDS